VTLTYWRRACTRRDCYHVEIRILDYNGASMSKRCAFEFPILAVALRTACDLARGNICRGRYTSYPATFDNVPPFRAIHLARTNLFVTFN